MLFARRLLPSLFEEQYTCVPEYLGLPNELINKVPSDGLTDKTDEDNLGFTYATLDRYIREGICENEEVKRKIDERHVRNLFKLQLMPSFPYKDNQP